MRGVDPNFGGEYSRHGHQFHPGYTQQRETDGRRAAQYLRRRLHGIYGLQEGPSCAGIVMLTKFRATI